MKRMLSASMLATALAAFAADQTVTGVITDSMCKTNHAMMQKGANKMSAQGLHRGVREVRPEIHSDKR